MPRRILIIIGHLDLEPKKLLSGACRQLCRWSPFSRT